MVKTVQNTIGKIYILVQSNLLVRRCSTLELRNSAKNNSMIQINNVMLHVVDSVYGIQKSTQYIHQLLYLGDCLSPHQPQKDNRPGSDLGYFKTDFH